jgi:ferredoxin
MSEATDRTSTDGRLRVVVDEAACMGARECSTTWAPHTFDFNLDKGTAFIVRGAFSRDEVLRAASGCPNFAITVYEDGVEIDP